MKVGTVLDGVRACVGKKFFNIYRTVYAINHSRYRCVSASPCVPRDGRLVPTLVKKQAVLLGELPED